MFPSQQCFATGKFQTLSVELWLQEKLRRCGLRSIDVVVDITNYILLELGQPMHAFDLNKLSGGIRVRLAEAGDIKAEVVAKAIKDLKIDSGKLNPHTD